jgi:hypothetical protein
VLSATAYEPVNYTEDRPPPADEPVAEPPQPSGTGPQPAPTVPSKPPGETRLKTPRTAPVAHGLPAKPALVGVDQGTLTLSLPAIEVRQAYTRTEVAVLGVKQHTEVEVPMLNVVF